MNRKKSFISLVLCAAILIGGFWTYHRYLEQVYLEKQLAMLGSLAAEDNIEKIACQFFESHDEDDVAKGQEVLKALAYPDTAIGDLKRAYQLPTWPLLLVMAGVLGIVGIAAVDQRKKYDASYMHDLECIMNHHYQASDSLDPVILQLNQFHDYVNCLEKEASDTKARMKLLIEDIAHQIKTPLTSLKLYVETSKDEKTKEKGLFQINRMETIVTALVDLAKLEAHTIQFQFRQHSLQDCLEEICEELWPLCEAKDIHLETEMEDVVFAFDDLWLSEALINILRNALQYTPPSGQVSLKTQVHEDFVTIEIRDQGPGFSEASARHIFDRFYTGSETASRKAQGMGIGLNIAKEVVLAHHGHLFASSHKEGACFLMELPLNLGKEKC